MFTCKTIDLRLQFHWQLPSPELCSLQAARELGSRSRSDLQGGEPQWWRGGKPFWSLEYIDCTILHMNFVGQGNVTISSGSSPFFTHEVKSRALLGEKISPGWFFATSFATSFDMFWPSNSSLVVANVILRFAMVVYLSFIGFYRFGRCLKAYRVSHWSAPNLDFAGIDNRLNSESPVGKWQRPLGHFSTWYTLIYLAFHGWEDQISKILSLIHV